MTMQDRLRAALLVAFAIAAPLGYVLDWRGAELIGVRSAASPLPLVFDGVDGIEYWAQQPVFRVRGSDGRSRSVTVGRGDFARVAGPHRWQLALTLPLSAPTELPERLLHAVLHRGLCDGGPLSEALGLGERLQDVRLFVVDPRAGAGRRVWQIGVQCSS